MEHIGLRIKELRKKLKLNQKEFADIIGISRTHISGIENGKDSPSSSLIKLICLKYNISEEWIVKGIGSSIPEFDTVTDTGLQSKYNLMRNLFEQWLGTQSLENKESSVQAFSFFVSTITSKKLNTENQIQYLESICSIMDIFEKIVFDAYMLDNYKNDNQNYKLLLDYKLKSDTAISLIDSEIKKCINIYLEQYNIDMKI